MEEDADLDLKPKIWKNENILMFSIPLHLIILSQLVKH